MGGGVQAVSTRHVGHWMAYCTCPGRLWWWRIWWNEEWQGKPKYSEKTCSSATLSTTNPTWPGPGSNPGRRGGKPATNRLSYGAASSTTCCRLCFPHTLLGGILLDSLFDTEDEDSMFLPNVVGLHGVTSQKMPFFIVTAVRTSNPMHPDIFQSLDCWQQSITNNSMHL
jgi:hypothetical protein